MLFVLSLFALAIGSCTSETIHVTSASSLQSALSNVKPGDTIQLADGEYHGAFTAHVSGTEGKPIVMTGSRKAALSSSIGYGLHLEKVSHWTLKGFTIHNSKKGLVLDHSSNNLIDNIEVHHIDEEGIHFRKDSSHNKLQNSQVHNTGLKNAGFGEGVYIGSAVKNWEGGHPDKSDYNVISHNHIGPNVAAESIDVKEGTEGGQIIGNHFDGTGMKGEHFADSWIDLKGDKYVVSDNVGEHSIKDGIEVHHQTAALAGLKTIGLLGGCHNKIHNNKCSGIHGQCVHVNIQSNTVVKSGDCTNDVQN